MSVVPLLFRDWWDDFDMPIRTSRLLDQHFGTGLRWDRWIFTFQKNAISETCDFRYRRDDLASSFWNSTPSILRSGYIRPWRNTALQKQDSGSTLNVDKDKFTVILDVQQFTPNEITVKTTDKFIIVEGKHEEKQDEHGFVARQFTRRYVLPGNELFFQLSDIWELILCIP